MKPGLNQSTQLKQELKINPRLYQAMDLLYMPLLDLQQHLKQELLNNPFLDMVEPDEEDEEEGGTEETRRPRSRRSRRRRTTRSTGRRSCSTASTRADAARSTRRSEYYEPVTVDTRDLGDHLRDQITLLDLNPRQMFLADEFIGNINEDGYLDCPLDEILSSRQRASSGRPPRSASVDVERRAAVHAGRGGRDARHRPEPRSAGRRRARPARVPDAAAQATRASSTRCRSASCATASRSSSRTAGARSPSASASAPSDVQRAADEIAKLDPKPGLMYSSATRQLHHPRPRSSTRSTASITSS